jgi:hypothetical protein
METETNIKRAQAALTFVDASDAIETMIASGVDAESAYLATVAATILNNTPVES